MENSLLTSFTNELFLRQSELFGNDYKYFETQTIHTFNDLSVSNLEDWKNTIFQKNMFLNDHQIFNFQNFLFSLTKVLETINPDKLKIKNDSFLEESELILWRESSKGISKLSFNKYGEIIYMFNGNDGKKVRGVFESGVDFDMLLYRFLSF